MRKGMILRTSLMTVLSLSLFGLSQEPHVVPAYDASAALSGNRTIESGLTGTGPFDHHEASGYSMGHHGRRRTISLQLHALWIFVRWRKRHQPSHARHLRSLQRHGGLSLKCAAKRTTDWKLFTIQRPHRRYLRRPVWGDVFIQREDGGGANTGLGNHGMETIQDFIARPDTQTSAVPEPASLLRLPLG